MKYCHYLFVALGITSAAILASCQDEDFGYTSDQIAYRTNFEKMYGSVKDIPTWDFSSYNLRQMGLEGGPSMQNSPATRSAKTHNWNTGGACHGAIDGATVGTDIVKDVESWFSVPSSTQSWMDTNLKEGQPHKSLGTPFALVKPENNQDFLIIPIYQGHSGMTWDLHLVAKNSDDALKDYKIWSHSENIRYSNSATDLVEFYYNTADKSSEGEKQNDLDEVGGDIYEWREGGVVRGILLYHAFQDLDAVNGSTIYLDVPAGGYVKAYVTNRYDQGEYASRWQIEADNSSGSSTGRFEFGLSGIKDQVWFPKDLWNLVMIIDYYNYGQDENPRKCSFDTFASDRVRIYTNNHTESNVTLADAPHGSSTQNYIYRHTIDRKNVEAKPIRIDCSKIKDDFYFYLDVTKGDDYVTGTEDQAATGARQRSDQNMMLALSVGGSLFNKTTLTSTVAAMITDYTNINSCEYFVIGCEDANLANSDWDLNDIVFLVVGLDKAPKVKELIKKRYMIEDLGGTFDFDFNDIVVDVTQEKLKNVSDGTYSTTFGTDGAKQYATLKHLCGTIPFKIKIGDTVIGESYHEGKFEGKNGGCSEGGSGYDPTNDTYYAPLMNADVTGWNPSTNNITVTTWPTQAGWTDPGTGGYVGNYPDGVSFSFPENKQYPYIIACDQTVGWMPELTSVPHTWFKTWKDDNYLNWTPTVPDNNQPVTPPTPTPTTEALSLDDLGSGWGDSSYDPATKTITFAENSSWTGKGWWFGENENGKDCSTFSKVVVKFASGIPCSAKVVIEYVDNTKDSPSTSESSVASASATSIECSFDKESKVKQIYIQSETAGRFVLSEAYLVKK